LKRIFLAAIAAGGIAALAGCGGNSAAPSTSGPARSSPAGQAAPTAVPTPETASQAAASLGATGFTDCGPSQVGGVIDGGTAEYQGYRIGIDTFSTATARAGWIQIASTQGVTPLYVGQWWVAYKATSQSGAACS
jgi:hypothetical protein